MNLLPCCSHVKGLFFYHSSAIKWVISFVPTLASLDVLGPLFQPASLLRCKPDEVCLLWRTHRRESTVLVAWLGFLGGKCLVQFLLHHPHTSQQGNVGLHILLRPAKSSVPVTCKVNRCGT